MRILLSPAKKMRRDTDSLPVRDLPGFLDRTEQILSYLRSQTAEQLQTLWGCNDAIAAQNLERLAQMDLRSGLTPAVLSYDGIAFQHMAPAVFTDSALAYVQDHLRILSGFYGVLRPMDGVTPYRLEMQAKAPVEGHKDLYDFWGSLLYENCRDGSGIFLNLASKEYSKAVKPFLQPGDTWIDCTFCELVKGKLTQKATFAKMARGEMVRYLAENGIVDPRDMAGFRSLDYRLREDLSTDAEYVFEHMVSGSSET